MARRERAAHRLAPAAAGGRTTGVIAPRMLAPQLRRPHRPWRQGATARVTNRPVPGTQPATGAPLSATGRGRPASPGVSRGARSRCLSQPRRRPR
eukprot:9047044-Alexandrium_andersonii.AAC.1